MKTPNSIYSRTLSAVALFFFSSLTTAREIKITAVPTIVTGSLKPLRVEIDGKPVIKDLANVSQIKINGVPVRPLPQKGSPFFYQSKTHNLEISSSLSEKKQTFSLPSAEILESRPEEILIQLVGGEQTAKIDKKKVPITNHQILWKLPRSEHYNLHVLELTLSHTGLKRTYNLEIFKLSPPPQPPPVTVRQVATKEAEPKAFQTSFSLAHLSIAPILAFQSSSYHSTNLNLGWTPQYQLSPSLLLFAQVGGNLFHSFATKRKFLFFESTFNIHQSLGNSAIFGGLGIQWWKSYGGFFPAFNLGFEKKITSGIWGISLEKVFVGYSAALTRPKLTHFLRLGFGVAL